jgi:hypothetical protein
MSAVRMAACLGLAGWLAACAGTTPTPTSTPTLGLIDRPTEAGELVLRVDMLGGLLPPLERERQLPTMSIYGDGLVIVPAEVPDIFPGPAGYAFRSFRIEDALVNQIVAGGLSIGLRGPERHLAQQGPEFVADAGATVVTLVVDGQRHVTSADALFDSADNTAERRLLAEFLERLAGIDRGGGQAHEADSYRVFVAAPDPGFEGDLEGGPPVAWPFDDALATWGEPMPADGLTVDARCRVIRGDELADALPFLRSATASTIVSDEAGTEAIVAYRPLLPDETGCDDE